MDRVRLLSAPQAAMAARTSKAPVQANPDEDDSRPRKNPAPVMAATAAHKRPPTGSRNTSEAISAVMTASKLRNNEVENPLSRDNPSKRRMGAATPPKATAAASRGKSRPVKGASGAGARRKSQRPASNKERPSPAPK